MNNTYGITNLRPDMLSDVVPSRVHGGGALIGDASKVLFLWRSCSTAKARGGSLCFFLSDARLEGIWKSPAYYALSFVRDGVKAAVEIDYSLWRDMTLEEQLHNIRRQKIISRIFQEYNLKIIPCLNWSGPESFAFAFCGIPRYAPIVMTECRTASSSPEDRKAFLCGLHAAIQQCQPAILAIYGGQPNRWWIERDLPAGDTQYVFLESWTDSRAKVRKMEARQAREKHQLSLFGGNEKWAEGDHQAA
jgi:hypothetical protein